MSVALGIDLGTTNSVAAIATPTGVEFILGPRGERVHPSVVAFPSSGGVVVGGDAKRYRLTEPQHVIHSAKRFIGQNFRAPLVQLAMTGVRYQLVEGMNQQPMVVVRDRQLTMPEISSNVLLHLKRCAERQLGTQIKDAVITVPANFTDGQRQATKEAGRLAGLEVMRLMAEPTAAAVAYGLDRGSKGTYAVFDLGGGTFDVSILKLVEGVFEVKATGGDSALGGDDLDRAIAREYAKLDGASPSEVAAAVAEARRVKEALTDAETAAFRGTRVTRADLRRIAQPLLDRCGKACRRVLKDAELAREDLDGVILVGGSTRSPVVRDFVREVFGKEPLHDLDPDQVVALGAAVQADVLAGGEQKVVLLDVVPLSLGIEMMGGVVEKLIHRNTTIPCGANQTFTTYADNQTGFDIHILQGERETVEACRSLARFTLKGVPPMIAGMARVEITFLVDADGLLRVTAKEETTGNEASIEVKPSYGLTDEEVERMLIESFEHAEDDLAARNLRIERVEADRILAATRQAFVTDAALLTADVRAAGEAAMADLAAAMAGTDYLKIRAAIEALDIATKPFAQLRMNRAVAAQLHGVSLDDAARKVGA
jgi:molecular chaperone HscA